MINFNEIIDNMVIPKFKKEELKKGIEKNNTVEVNGKTYKLGQEIISKKHKLIILQAACDKIIDGYHNSIVAEKKEVKCDIDDRGMITFTYGVWTSRWPISMTGTVIDMWVGKDNEISGEDLVDKMTVFIGEGVNDWFDKKFKMKKKLEERVKKEGLSE